MCSTTTPRHVNEALDTFAKSLVQVREVANVRVCQGDYRSHLRRQRPGPGRACASSAPAQRRVRSLNPTSCASVAHRELREGSDVALFQLSLRLIFFSASL
jgi:hypothetical protein